MQRTFLEDTYAGYKIQQWADHANVTIVRVTFNSRGSLVYHIPRSGK